MEQRGNTDDTETAQSRTDRRTDAGAMIGLEDVFFFFEG